MTLPVKTFFRKRGGKTGGGRPKTECKDYCQANHMHCGWKEASLSMIFQSNEKEDE